MHTFPEPVHHLGHKHALSGLILFAAVMFVYALGDAVMSYLAPNIVETLVDNPLLMGIVISSSSAVGFCCDYIFSNVLKEKRFFTYAIMGILIAALFPLLLLVKIELLVILAAMAVWGTYYELILFAKSNYIHHHLPHDKHDTGWAYMNAFTGLAYMLGPSLAVTLLFVDGRVPLLAALALQAIAFIGILIYRLVYRKRFTGHSGYQPSIGLVRGIASWKILNRKLWPILLFLFCLILLDATFWTVGAILVNQLKDSHPFASLLYVAYLLPTLIIGPIGIRLSQAFGKKRTAFISALIAGLIFSLTYFTSGFIDFILCIALGSVLLAIATPEIRGVIEDYCERLGGNANSLVGLTGSMGSLAFIIGPIISGGIASVVGNMKTFGVVGFILCLTSVLSLLIVPRKVRLPQSELKAVFDMVSG